ncbi:MAG TPA: AbrB/MazE/SpoVT family DNA-binding domain-containing protein [Candidatus Aminicenantes bacterium]|nr:AbrB/MazE/SpoVT family DNA-binding domain-containing protein [Candidatus Aminicenantes bacterium]HRY66124.1 AbrB/MazE/SpoVT family DNA-binding domain-containing protein [Candidatus Aminicenantes bacterium]HRZ73038.1 AbrB/MazE/SpoVT family DNA-binding domain-containing protein [Candidatus Aminicenantes bacterium]
MTTATVSSKSQITLPAAACRETGIKPHDRVLVEVREGTIVIRSAPDLMDFEGVLGKALPRAVEIKKAARAVADRLRKAT